MKKISSLLTVLKTIIKYGAYVMVLVDVLQYAVEKFSTVDTEKPVKNADSEPVQEIP